MWLHHRLEPDCCLYAAKERSHVQDAAQRQQGPAGSQSVYHLLGSAESKASLGWHFDGGTHQPLCP